MALSCTGILTHLAGTYLQPVEWEQTGEAGQRGRAEIQAGSRDCQRMVKQLPLGHVTGKGGFVAPRSPVPFHIWGQNWQSVVPHPISSHASFASPQIPHSEDTAPSVSNRGSQQKSK